MESVLSSSLVFSSLYLEDSLLCKEEFLFATEVLLLVSLWQMWGQNLRFQQNPDKAGAAETLVLGRQRGEVSSDGRGHSSAPFLLQTPSPRAGKTTEMFLTQTAEHQLNLGTFKLRQPVRLDWASLLISIIFLAFFFFFAWNFLKWRNVRSIQVHRCGKNNFSKKNKKNKNRFTL